MEMQEWQGYVYKMLHCDYPIPPQLVSNYDDWKCRSVVGRMLLILKDVEGAMNVLATVKDIEPDMEDAPDFGLSEAEHKVLCLRDIAEIIWKLTGRLDAPLVYLKEADRLCRAYKYTFRSADRGAIWARRLEMLRESGEEDAAIAEVKKALAEQKEEGINTYRFHAYKFLAESMAKRGDFAKASLVLAEAFKSAPLSDAGRKELAAAAAEQDAEKRYNAYMHATTIRYAPWEDDDVPTLDEVHELQMRNFEKREAAKKKKEADLNNNLK